MRELLAPRFWPVHLLLVVLLGLAGTLGAWQYDAWQARRAAEAADLTRLEPVPLQEAIGPDDPFPGDRVGQPVVLAGEWLPEATVFVSGRELGGRDGYWVVTSLVAGGSALPVVRGWVADPSDAPAAPTGAAELVGWLQPGEGGAQVDDDPGDDVLPQLRIADLAQLVDRDLYGAYAVVADRAAPGDWPVGDAATNDGTEGLAAASPEQLPPADRFTALRNLLYALEWWVFGGFALLIWWRYLQDSLRQDSDQRDRAKDDPRRGAADQPVPSGK